MNLPIIGQPLAGYTQLGKVSSHVLLLQHPCDLLAFRGVCCGYVHKNRSNDLKERLLDQAWARMPHSPPFWGVVHIAYPKA